MKFLILKGVQYEGETLEEMAAREKKMEAHNRKIKEMEEAHEKWKKTPHWEMK